MKVVPADTSRFGEGHGFNTSPSAGTSAAVASASGKIREKAQLLAGAALGAEPESLTWAAGAFTTGGDSPGVPDDRRPRPVRARHRRAAARGRGRTRCPDRLQGLEPGVDGDLDLVGDLERPEQGRVRLDAPVALPDGRPPGQAPVLAPQLEGDRAARARQLELSVDGCASCRPDPARGRSSGTRSWRPSAPRRRSSARCPPSRRRRAP